MSNEHIQRWRTIAKQCGWEYDRGFEAWARWRGRRVAVLSVSPYRAGEVAALVFQYEPEDGGRPEDGAPFSLIWGTHPDAPLVPETTSDEFVRDELRLAEVVAARGWPLPVRAPELLAARG